jgi:hypothetical protein
MIWKPGGVAQAGYSHRRHGATLTPPCHAFHELGRFLSISLPPLVVPVAT